MCPLDGFTPLHYAARWGNEDVLKRLLEAKGNIEVKNNTSITALMSASIGEHSRCIQILVLHGANVSILLPTLDAISLIPQKCSKRILAYSIDVDGEVRIYRMCKIASRERCGSKST